MSILNFMKEDTSEISEYEQHLWEDLLPALRKLSLHDVDIRADITLFETDIRSFLLDNGVPPKLIYPIMRINGYENYGEIVASDASIRVPVIESLEGLYDEVRETLVI
jgi:hypothetical protein